MNNARFLAIFNQSAIAIQIYNREGKCVAVNKAWELLFDTSISELETYNVLQDPQVKASPVYECIMRAFNGEENRVPENLYDPALSGKKGRARWLSATFAPVKDLNGHVNEIAILFSDITEVKIAQLEVSRSRDRLKEIFDHIPEGIIVMDDKFQVQYANPKALTLSLSHRVDWNDKAIHDHFEFMREDGTIFPMEELPSRKVFRGEEVPPEVIVRHRHKQTGEEKVALVSTRPMCDDAGNPKEIIIMFRDITEKLKIETKLREAMEAKDLFFSVASHELRTPITALKLNAQLINLTRTNVSPDALLKMDRQVNKLSKLVDEMLDISRLSRGTLNLQRKQMNLSHLTREVLAGMMDQLKVASIPLTVKITENISGNWDPDRLEQVLENLVTNAIRYARNSPLYVSLSATDQHALLEVSDQGPGIPEEDHAKIFNRFEQSRSFGERSGMGLGLYIVREIVALHGGKISVSNIRTGGARFVIELPFLHGG